MVALQPRPTTEPNNIDESEEDIRPHSRERPEAADNTGVVKSEPQKIIKQLDDLENLA
jgi:hypothetical protein